MASILGATWNDEPEKDQELLEAIDTSSQATTCITTIVEYTADRMAYLVRKHKIATEVSCILWGEAVEGSGVPKKMIDMSIFEKIRKAARAMMRQRAAVTQVEAREDSIAYWETILSDPDAPYAVRARARENLDKINCITMPDVSLLVQANAKKTVSLSDLGLDLESKKKALNALRAAKADQDSMVDARDRALNVASTVLDDAESADDEDALVVG
jgi:hypothetical protein